MKKYQQLNLRQRYQIWTGLNRGMKQKEIAIEVGVHKSSISRELKRNWAEDRKIDGILIKDAAGQEWKLYRRIVNPGEADKVTIHQMCEGITDIGTRAR